jgi:hypothetical protein
MMCSAKRLITLSTAICSTVALVVATSNTAYAYPSLGPNCAGCHGQGDNDRLEVTGTESTLDLDNGLGELKSFAAAPGGSVELGVTVGSGTSYTVTLYDFYKGGQKNDGNNMLVYADDNDAGNAWTSRTAGEQEPVGQQYFTKSGSGAGSAYTFNLLVDATTPPDVYQLSWGVGQSNADNAMFYLNVVPEPTAAALAALGLVGLIACRRRRV